MIATCLPRARVRDDVFLQTCKDVFSSIHLRAGAAALASFTQHRSRGSRGCWSADLPSRAAQGGR